MPARTARRGGRSDVLPDLRQPVRLLSSATSRAPKRRRRRSTRASFPFVKEALASIDKGGYAEALARVAFLMAHKDEPLPLSRLQLAHDLLEEYRELLPELPPDEARRIGGEQEIIARYEPDKAVETLPVLLADAEGPRSPAHAARSRARRQARATHPALGRAERDARAYSRRARRRGAPAGRVAARFSADPRQCSGHDCKAARRAGEEVRRSSVAWRRKNSG